MSIARTRNGADVAYRFQRVYAGLRTGHSLTVQATRKEPVRPFMQQSDLDGACGVHLLATVLAIFGLAKASALHEMSLRKQGLPAAVWLAFKHTYFTGVHATEWVDLVNSLGLPLRLTAKHGAHDNADRHVVEWLMKGDLVALAFASVRHQRTKHWALAVGIEGAVVNKSHQPDAILLLDPSASEPTFTPHNARLCIQHGKQARWPYASNGVGQRRGAKTSAVTYLYEALEWNTEAVQLLAAVRLVQMPPA